MIADDDRQTADTFQAASTFFELVNIWGPPDAETQAKVKYAKWNAVRIAKALKEGKDPNESNPRPQIQEEKTLPTLDPDDPDVLRIGGPDKPEKPRQASVEEVPDEQDHIDRRMARQSSIDQSLHPSAQVSARGSPAGTFEPYPRNGFPYNAVQDDNVSPLEPSPNDRNGSIGGGYFPEVPTFTSQSRDSTLPTAPPDDVIDLGLPEQPSVAPGSGPAPDFESFPPPRTLDDEPSAQDYYTAPPPVIKAPSPPFQPPPHPHTQLPTPQFQQPPPTQIQAPRQPLHPQQPQYQGPPPVPQTQPHNQNYNPGLQPRYPHHPNPPPAQSQSFAPATPTPMAAPRNYGKEQLITDDVAIAKAQKHARWAISALNFEDAETAVRELRDALRTLGAAA
jgi:vacuolar protein sorting-associated protein VTA1